MRPFRLTLAIMVLVVGCEEKRATVASPRDAGSRDAPVSPFDGASRPDGGGPDGARAEDQAVDVLIGRLRESLMAHPGNDRASRQAVLTDLQGDPAFVRGGLSHDRSLWIRLTNGHYIGVASPRQHTASPRVANFDENAPISLPQGLPSSAKAYVGIAVDTGCGFANHETMISSWLGDHGYQVSNAEPTPDVLRAVDDTGVFHLNTHGMTLDDEAQGTHLALFQSTMRENTWEGLLARFPTENDADEMTLMMDNSCTPPVSYIAYTHKFVEHYMHFPANSFVFLDSCSSFDPSMVAAFRTAGASIYLGWTNTVNDDAAAITKCTLYDLLLGQNVVSAANLRVPEPAIPLRPFDFPSSWAAVVMRGLTMSSTDEDGPVELLTNMMPDGLSILRPSLLRLSPNPTNSQMLLFGSFGPPPGGAVTVGGAEVQVTDWSDFIVTTTIPASAEGAVAVTAGGHTSNALPLTRWTATFAYTNDMSPTVGVGSGSLQQTFTCTISFRSDVHFQRGLPLNPVTSPATTVSASEDSSCTWQMSGEGTAGTGLNRTMYSLAGQGTVRPGAGLGFVATINPAMTTMTITGPGVAMQGELTVTDLQTGETTMSPIGLTPSDPTVLPSARSPLPLQMDSGFNTMGGTRSTFTWSPITATSTPIPGQTPG